MIPLYSVKDVRQIDTFAIERLGFNGLVLMENAAHSVLEAILSEYQPGYDENFAILCGKGNNGGDGFAVARQLANRGYAVSVLYVAGASDLSPDAFKNFSLLQKQSTVNSKIRLKKFYKKSDINFLKNHNYYIDALLGSGTVGILKKPYDYLIRKLNAFKGIKIAIDVPSGLDANLGTGLVIFKADLTVTLGEFKKGLFFNDGYVFSGKVVKGNIGVDEIYYDLLSTNTYLIEPEDANDYLPVKEKQINKYTAGKLLVIAGSGLYPGAAVLTSKAALKIGAGSVVLAFPKSVRHLVYKNLKEVVVEQYLDKDEQLSVENISELSNRISWSDTIIIGPGLGRNNSTQEAVIELIKKYHNKKLVIDADAIYALHNGLYKKLNLSNAIITPHWGEFCNLLNISKEELKNNLFNICKKFVSLTSCYLVLKGAPTIIFPPSGEALINSTGNPGMAKFGSGDVLAGVLAGLLAQGKNIEGAVISGVYLHSLSADILQHKLTEYSYVANDILNNIPVAIKFLRKSIVK